MSTIRNLSSCNSNKISTIIINSRPSRVERPKSIPQSRRFPRKAVPGAGCEVDEASLKVQDQRSPPHKSEIGDLKKSKHGSSLYN